MKITPPKKPLRVVLYPSDVGSITGRSERTARRLLQRVRLAFGKSEIEFVTVREFCTFYGIDEELVKDFLHT